MAVDAKSINIHMQVTGPFPAQMAGAGASVQTFGNQANAGMAKAQAGMARFGKIASTLGATAAIGIAVGLGLGAKAAIDFESSFAGVRKTVEAGEPMFQRLAMGVRQMAKEIPIGVNELNRIMELGGQLGVDAGGLLEFTETIANIGVTTTLSTEEAATGFARIDNVMQLGEKSFDRMGSSIVDLGNNFAATESEILTFTTRIAPIGATLGSTTDEVLAIATAFTSVGIPAERGGTAVQKTFIKIAEAAALGGEELETFAMVAGVTAEEFQRIVKTDPTEAFRLFVNGLAGLEEQGINTFGVLDSVDLSNQRVISSLLAMSSAEGVLDEALRLSKEAWKDNLALTEEAEKRYGTTASQLGLLKNGLVDVGISIGQQILPAINDFILGLQTVGEWIGSLHPAVKGFTGVILGMTAALWAMEKHPIILGISIVAAGIVMIGRNAARAKERVEGLQHVLERGFADVFSKEQLEKQLGAAELDALLGSGFSLIDIDKAITGTEADFNELVSKAEALWISTLRRTDPDLFGEKYDMFADSGAFNFRANEGDVQEGIAMIEKARGVLAGLKEEAREINAARGGAKRLGLGHLLPGGDEEQAIVDKRTKLLQDMRNLRLGLEAEADETYEFKPVFNREQADTAIRLFDEYAMAVQEAFAESQQARLDEIDGWYEFDEDFEVAFDQVLATIRRQVAASIGFEDLLHELNLDAAVEGWIRSIYGSSPSGKEAFLNSVLLDRDAFLEEVTEIAIAARAEFARQWFRDDAPALEGELDTKFIEDWLAAGIKAVEEDDRVHGNPVDLWIGFMKQSLANAPTAQWRADLLGIFTEPAFLASLGVPAQMIQFLIDMLNNLPNTTETTVRINIEWIGDDPPYYPGSEPDVPVVLPWTGGDPDFNAFGGNVMGGRPTIVGEYGPEIFVPFGNGTIVPNSKLGGGGGTSIEVNVIRPETSDLAGDIAEGLTRASIAEQVDLIGAF